MGKFSWGPTFLELNRELLDLYASCTDAKDVVDKQNTYIQQQKQVVATEEINYFIHCMVYIIYFEYQF